MGKPSGTTTSQFTQLSELYRSKRQQQKLSVKQVAQRTGLPAKLTQKMEAGDLGPITVAELSIAARGLGCVFRISLAPERAPLPKLNGEILSAFDHLIRSGRFKPFVRSEPDEERPVRRWDIIGDVDRNWLYVVASLA